MVTMCYLTTSTQRSVQITRTNPLDGEFVHHLPSHACMHVGNTKSDASSSWLKVIIQSSAHRAPIDGKAACSSTYCWDRRAQAVSVAPNMHAASLGTSLARRITRRPHTLPMKRSASERLRKNNGSWPLSGRCYVRRFVPSLYEVLPARSSSRPPTPLLTRPQCRPGTSADRQTLWATPYYMHDLG